MKRILIFAVLVPMGLIFNEMRTGPDPDKLIFRKEAVSSWIPAVEKYYLHDGLGGRYKVSGKIYDGYRLWSEEKGIYANGRVAQAMKDAAGKRERDREKESRIDTAKLLVRKGLDYSKGGDYDRAIINSSRAIEICPGYAGAYALRAIAYSYKDEFDKCRADVNKAQELGYRFNPEFLENLKELEEEP